jgi:hypothetical protein
MPIELFYAMGAHVFVVDENTLTVHTKFLFCGVVNPSGIKERYGIYADLMNLRVGDLVFFYQRYSKDSESNGFNGIYEVTGEPFFPFFDSTEIIDQTTGKKVVGKCECGYEYSAKRKNQFSPAKCLNCGRIVDYPILPNRVPIRVKVFYEKSVKDDYAYVDHTDHGVLWTMLFRKTTGAGRARSIMHILPEEGEKLGRLLKDHNRGNTIIPTTQSYPATPRKPLVLNIMGNVEKDGTLKFETVLQAWIMQNIDKQVNGLKEIVGPLNELEYFGAWVPYSLSTETVDILCLHRRDGARFKATVIELKNKEINQAAVDQTDNYTDWIAQLATENAEPEIDAIQIQPVIIGSKKARYINLPRQRTFTRKYYSNSLSGKRNDKHITINVPQLLTYKVVNGSVEFCVLPS